MGEWARGEEYRPKGEGERTDKRKSTRRGKKTSRRHRRRRRRRPGGKRGRGDEQRGRKEEGRATSLRAQDLPPGVILEARGWGRRGGKGGRREGKGGTERGGEGKGDMGVERGRGLRQGRGAEGKGGTRGVRGSGSVRCFPGLEAGAGEASGCFTARGEARPRQSRRCCCTEETPSPFRIIFRTCDRGHASRISHPAYNLFMIDASPRCT